MDDPITTAKAAAEGYVEEAWVQIDADGQTPGVFCALRMLKDRLDGVLEAMARRVLSGAPDVPGTQRDRVVEALSRFEEVDPEAAGDAGVGNLLDELVGSRPREQPVQTFGAWLSSQPALIQDRVLGYGRAERFRKTGMLGFGDVVVPPVIPPDLVAPRVERLGGDRVRLVHLGGQRTVRRFDRGDLARFERGLYPAGCQS